MARLENVVLVGATGTVGTSILSALRAANFNITVLTRSGSTSSSKLPEGTRVITADYASHESLVSAFKGADAVVSALGRLVTPTQMPLIDAAVDAGVKRFLPSEYGGDTFNEKVRVMPGLQEKAVILDHLARMAEEGKIEWTAIMTGPFLDWGLRRGIFGMNFSSQKMILYDNGTTHISSTNVSELGRAVVGVLTHPAETRNKPIYVQSVRFSQLELLEIVERHAGAKYEREHVDTAERSKKGLEKIKSGDMSGLIDWLPRAAFAEGHGCDFDGREANTLVGVRELSKGELSDLVGEVMASVGVKQ